MPRSVFTLRLALISGVSWLAAGAGAYAQTSQTEVASDTVIVTGQLISGQSVTKSDATIAETPQSVSMIPRELMEAQAVHNVSQTMRYAPGITAEPRGVMTGFDYF